MKRRILLLSVLSGWMLLPTQAKMFNPFEEAPLNGPIKEVMMSNPDKKKWYSQEIYNEKGILIESGRYKKKSVEFLQAWTQSDMSEYVYRGIHLNRKRKQKDNHYVIAAYNEDGTIQEKVNMQGTVILGREFYEYNDAGQLTKVYISKNEQPKSLNKMYTYNEDGRLEEYCYYFNDKPSYGYKLEYSDSIVLKQGFHGEQKSPDDSHGVCYLDSEGRVRKKIEWHGVYDSYTQTEYLQYDQYGNWTDKIVTNYTGDSQTIKLGDIEYKNTRIEDAVIYLPSDRRDTQHWVRQISYYE